MAKAKQPLALRQTAGKATATMNTKPLQGNLAEFTCNTVQNM